MPRLYNLVWRIAALLRDGEATEEQMNGLAALISPSPALASAAIGQIPELKTAMVCITDSHA